VASTWPLLELNITLALDECGVPWNLRFLLSQLGVELSVRRTIDRHSLELAVFVALIGVEESINTY
jgi:hypothetical protein